MDPITPNQNGNEIDQEPPVVLAVDDQRDSLRLLDVMLSSAGFRCLTCADASGALAILAETRVDVIILDVMMPEVNGYELCKTIKGRFSSEDIPILFLSAKLDTTDIITGLNAGGHDYLSKPIQRDELVARTRAALRVKRLQDRLRGQIALKERINDLHQGMLGQHWEKTFGQLAASLAHEINNPLAAAIGNLHLISMQQDLAPETLRRLKSIDASLQRAGGRLRSLLLIAHNPLGSQRIDLKDLVEDLLTLINYHLVMNKVEVVKSLVSGHTWVGGVSELARAILYIFNNAIEVMADADRSVLTVEMEVTDQVCTITISDNGPGIPPEKHAQVFEPFYTTKTGGHHYGLGLFLAQRIVEKLGLSLQLRSPGPVHSTDFKILIPLNLS